MLSYLGFRFIQILSHITPISVLYFFSAIAGCVWFVCDKNSRASVVNNLERISKLKPHDPRHLIKPARQVFVNFYKYLFEFFKYSNVDKEWVSSKVDIIGEDNLINALKLQRGVIVLSMHLGNWELGAKSTAVLGYDVNVVALISKNPRVAKLFSKLRKRNRVRLIDTGKAVIEVFDALKRNEIVALLADFERTDKGFYIDLFENPVFLSRGPFIIAEKTKAPVVPCAMVRTGKGKFELIFKTPIILSDPDKYKEIIREMEIFIGKYPRQWCIFRDVWGGQ